ncbi:hypothetical protein TSOC_001438 [Tetrabaena socialis]|uniref:Plastid lipid-associated protein/fibrillin conserved domain-containing protein n=1 Tax=Tetrabaena socialis TaxID=47790 RepID=A0A2J8AGP6_9CHLO|nr:hypothetical protein TSOC_001438 [Tetrabaena socialis]|eukprot:PNH11682.1 hypothetical protein TSOC_001438 [Tetrabaena socialis]
MALTTLDPRTAFRSRPLLARRRATVQVRAAATGAPDLWQQLQQALSFGDRSGGRQKLRAASGELLRLLTAEPAASDVSRCSELVDELVAGAEGQPFRNECLAGGPWVVRYTRGKPLLWSLTAATSRLVNGRNRASQQFDPADGSAANKVELNGPDTYVAAYGTYEPVDDTRVTPKSVRARIGRGLLRAWGVDVPLPISGTGLFEVLYGDDSVRVFRSSGNLIAVQVRADRLPEL